MSPRASPLLLTLSVTLLGTLVVSGMATSDRATWLMEVAPVMLALPILWRTRIRFPLTPILYWLIFLHACVLIVGGTYSYAHVPLGDWLARRFDLSRNPYDKIGHFFQGFVPALIAREVFRRGGFVRGRRMLVFLILCVVLAISATYELVEWAAALALGADADEFLATQGDPWDTQSDMLLAFIGATSALWLLSSFHDRQLVALASPDTD